MTEALYMLNTLLILRTAGIQSRFAPLPTWLHVVFCIVATVLFIALYIRHRRVNDILWLIVCDLTLLLQFSTDRYTAYAVGICEAILLVMIFLQHHSDKKESKAASGSSSAKGSSPDSDDLSDVEKAVKTERKQIIKDNSGDIIGQAFDNEGFDK